jgi:hypothetical protein
MRIRDGENSRPQQTVNQALNRQTRPCALRARALRLRARAVLLLLAALGAAGNAGNCAVAATGAAPPIRHVFVIVLENERFAITFARHSPAPYLARELAARGALLRQYHAIGHNSLPNYIAMISGQAPNSRTQGDCVQYAEFERVAEGLDEHGQALGRGCIYPRDIVSLPDQLEAAQLRWRGYMEDMGRDPTREAQRCGHAVAGSRDLTLLASPRDQYSAKHNPFVYFHAIIDDPARCESHVVPLEELSRDLQTAEATPELVFITPNLCHDGHDRPCIDGEPGGLESADRFLVQWVPRILASPAFARDGLLVITFDEAGAGPESSTACCGAHRLSVTPLPPGLSGPGGGRIGAVLLSPWIAPGTISDVPYNHYSLLRSIEEIFALPPLGYAGAREIHPFGRDVYASRRCAAATAPGCDARGP